MSFKVELDKESGKYKIYNGKKKEYSKRMFKTKDSATKVAGVYANFGKAKVKIATRFALLLKRFCEIDLEGD